MQQPPAPRATADEAVARHLALLDTLGERPVAEHVLVFDAVQRGLAELLAAPPLPGVEPVPAVQPVPAGTAPTGTVPTGTAPAGTAPTGAAPADTGGPREDPGTPPSGTSVEAS